MFVFFIHCLSQWNGCKRDSSLKPLSVVLPHARAAFWRDHRENFFSTFLDSSFLCGLFELNCSCYPYRFPLNLNHNHKGTKSQSHHCPPLDFSIYPVDFFWMNLSKLFISYIPSSVYCRVQSHGSFMIRVFSTVARDRIFNLIITSENKQFAWLLNVDISMFHNPVSIIVDFFSSRWPFALIIQSTFQETVNQNKISIRSIYLYLYNCTDNDNNFLNKWKR